MILINVYHDPYCSILITNLSVFTKIIFGTILYTVIKNSLCIKCMSNSRYTKFQIVCSSVRNWKIHKKCYSWCPPTSIKRIQSIFLHQKFGSILTLDQKNDCSESLLWTLGNTIIQKNECMLNYPFNGIIIIK